MIPITSDLKFCTAAAFDFSTSLCFRGRARVGRGGRVIFDRSAPHAHRKEPGEDEEDEEVVGAKRSRSSGLAGGDRRSVGALWHEMLSVRPPPPPSLPLGTGVTRY